MGIISWIVVGLIAGALAKLVLPGDDPGGIIVTAIIGMVGAVVGGLCSGSLAARELRDSMYGLFWWLRWERSYCCSSTA